VLKRWRDLLAGPAQGDTLWRHAAVTASHGVWYACPSKPLFVELGHDDPGWPVPGPHAAVASPFEDWRAPAFPLAGICVRPAAVCALRRGCGSGVWLDWPAGRAHARLIKFIHSGGTLACPERFRRVRTNLDGGPCT